MIGRVLGWRLEAASAENFMQNGEDDNGRLLLQLESGSAGI